MPDLNAKVVFRLELVPGLMILRVSPEGWEVPPFKPGQFAVLGLPAHAPRSATALPEAPAAADAFHRRAYSIASSSHQRDTLEFYIVEVPTGALTPRLFALKEGDRLWMGPKLTGMFTLDQVSPDRDLVLIATGTGLAPYMSMLRSQLALAPGRRFAVIHLARDPNFLGYRQELFHMQRDHPNFRYLPFITDARPGAWDDAVGGLKVFWDSGGLEHSLGWEISVASTDLLLCGNPWLTETLMKLLQGRGFREHSRREPGQVHFEKYW